MKKAMVSNGDKVYHVMVGSDNRVYRHNTSRQQSSDELFRPNKTLLQFNIAVVILNLIVTAFVVYKAIQL